MSRANVAPFLDKNFSVLVKTAAIEKGMKALIIIEVFAKAARWHGYTILDGFVPVRKRNQKTLVTPKKSRLLFLILSLFPVLL